VLTIFGSLGDLYPYIAVARGLQARGHEAIIATTCHHRQRIEARGIGFRPVRPDGPDLDTDRDVLRRIMNPRKGVEYVICELLMPAVRESYEDILAAAQGADLLVSHVLTYATRLVAEKRGIPWASSCLQPLGFFSAYDPPVLPQLLSLSKLSSLSGNRLGIGKHFNLHRSSNSKAQIQPIIAIPVPMILLTDGKQFGGSIPARFSSLQRSFWA
jgi:UDP:flavonoid glycosyltransferase YjiC (YdhE family)